MPAPTISASAPGSLMLLGEHAVLHGHRALVAAVDQRLRVALSPRNDRTIEITSALGQHRTELETLEHHPRFHFVMEAIRRQAPTLPCGFSLQIESDFSHTIGFGSSAAVTVATVATLRAFARTPTDPDAVRDESIAVIRAVQGRGSGADVAASTHGGIVAYRAEPREVRVLTAQFDLCAVYSGYKTPTPEVISRVEELWADQPEALQHLYALINENVETGIAALEANDLRALGASLNAGQLLMDRLGVNTPELAAIVDALQADPGIHGAKISGSGLGDCAIGLGAPQAAHLPSPPIPASIAPAGFRIESPI
ncbi:MAG: GHMP kinase [Kiritimatiellae bacterium]|nr:GHMP kinase [Kiritimatiellia bacterium]MCO5061475.1 GHMP kinase [Kiritimatiellia bacterium]MCO6400782.1 GHMP kinase [Verrucomicrobiota bacterium]